MKQILQLLAIVLCVFVLCESSSPCLNRKLNEKQKRYVSILKTPSDFSLKLLKMIEKTNTNNNVILSPTSIYHLAFMIYILANQNGVKTKELKKLLNLPHEFDGNNFLAYIKLLEKYDMLNETQLENRIYYDSRIKPYDNINKLLCRELEAKNFRFRLNESIDSINDWIKQTTNNFIQEGIQKDKFELSPDVLLLNLFYFKGTWVSIFDKMTYKWNFTDENGQKLITNMMIQESNYTVWEMNELDSRLIEIPYKRNFSMFILLPKGNKKGTISRTLSLMDDEFITKMMTLPKKLQAVQLFLPKFSMEKEFDVLKILEKFNVRISDIGLDRLSENGDSLLINSGMHVSKIQVNQHGTEAAALSNSVFTKTVYTYFNCRQPFIYFICDMSTQSVLFEGIYRKPEDSDLNQKVNQELNDKIYFRN